MMSARLLKSHLFMILMIEIIIIVLVSPSIALTEFAPVVFDAKEDFSHPTGDDGEGDYKNTAVGISFPALDTLRPMKVILG